ncbi:MAG: hypothetical protein C5S48_02360 [Candidatus Methanogaster sp.]|nr:MAG: hypothetical protein C5S48_02360 [ANME-2 cluster archaeon]
MSSDATQIYGTHKTHGTHESGWVTSSTDEYESVVRTILVLPDSVVLEKVTCIDSNFVNRVITY